MGLKIGELFMDLGFEVDEKTLKNFHGEIKDTMNSMLRLVGVSASLAGFVSVMSGASDTALALRNMTKEFGYSAEGMQRWAAIAHQANPLVSHEQGLASYIKMAEYLRDMRMGKNDGLAFGMFGGSIEDNTPEKMQERIRRNLPQVVKNYGLDQASAWIDQITGSIGAINAFTMSLKDMEEAAEKGKRSLADDKQLVEMRLQVAGLKEEWDVFLDHIAASFAPALTKIMKAGEKGGFWGGVDAIGEWDPLNLGGASKWIQDKISGAAHRTSGYIERHGLMGINQDESTQFWLNRGYTPAQAAAFVAQEKHESNFDPTAVGDGGKGRGSFQMHPDRAKAILKATGIDVSTANHYRQLQGAAWDFENSGLAEKFKHILNPGDAAAFLSKNWERPADQEGEAATRARSAEQIAKTITVNAPITIHSNASAEDVAYHAVSELNRQITDTNAQTDLGPAH